LISMPIGRPREHGAPDDPALDYLDGSN